MSYDDIKIRKYSPSSLNFHFGELGYVGKLFVEDRVLHFEGDVDKSAQSLFEHACKIFNQDQEQKNREIRNKAFEEAAVAVDRLAYDAGEAEWRTEFSLSFASDLIRGLKEG